MHALNCGQVHHLCFNYPQNEMSVQNVGIYDEQQPLTAGGVTAKIYGTSAKVVKMVHIARNVNLLVVFEGNQSDCQCH